MLSAPRWLSPLGLCTGATASRAHASCLRVITLAILKDDDLMRGNTQSTLLSVVACQKYTLLLNDHRANINFLIGAKLPPVQLNSLPSRRENGKNREFFAVKPLAQ